MRSTCGFSSSSPKSPAPRPRRGNRLRVEVRWNRRARSAECRDDDAVHWSPRAGPVRAWIARWCTEPRVASDRAGSRCRGEGARRVGSGNVVRRPVGATVIVGFDAELVQVGERLHAHDECDDAQAAAQQREHHRAADEAREQRDQHEQPHGEEGRERFGRDDFVRLRGPRSSWSVTVPSERGDVRHWRHRTACAAAIPSLLPGVHRFVAESPSGPAIPPRKYADRDIRVAVLLRALPSARVTFYGAGLMSASGGSHGSWQ